MTMAFGGDSPGCPAINGSLEAGSGIPVAATCAGAKDTFSRPPTDLRGNPGAFGNRCSGVMTAQPWAACNMPIVRGRGKYDDKQFSLTIHAKAYRIFGYVMILQLCRYAVAFSKVRDPALERYAPAYSCNFGQSTPQKNKPWQHRRSSLCKYFPYSEIHFLPEEEPIWKM